MSHQVISKAERIKLFLRDCYLRQKTWVKIMRVVGGPVLIAIGADFYFDAHRSTVAYGGFCFLYGIYYTLKPLLIIAIRPTLFQELDFNLVVNELEVIIREDDIESIIQYKLFKSILLQTSYYALKLPNKATLYLRVDQLSGEEKSFLNKHLTV